MSKLTITIDRRDAEAFITGHHDRHIRLAILEALLDEAAGAPGTPIDDQPGDLVDQADAWVDPTPEAEVVEKIIAQGLISGVTKAAENVQKPANDDKTAESRAHLDAALTGFFGACRDLLRTFGKDGGRHD